MPFPVPPVSVIIGSPPCSPISNSVGGQFDLHSCLKACAVLAFTAGSMERGCDPGPVPAPSPGGPQGLLHHRSALLVSSPLLLADRFAPAAGGKAVGASRLTSRTYRQLVDLSSSKHCFFVAKRAFLATFYCQSSSSTVLNLYPSCSAPLLSPLQHVSNPSGCQITGVQQAG